MAFPVSLLLTRAHCALALEALRLERRIFTLKDENLDLRADMAVRRATERAAELAEAQATVARLTPLLTTLTAGTIEFVLNSRLLRTATRQVENLTAPTVTATADPVAAFLRAVDAVQAAAQLPVLDAAIAEVEAHQTTLPA